jgi:hypothetical protein
MLKRFEIAACSNALNHKDLFVESHVQSLTASVQLFHETLKQLNSGWIQFLW